MAEWRIIQHDQASSWCWIYEGDGVIGVIFNADDAERVLADRRRALEESIRGLSGTED